MDKLKIAKRIDDILSKITENSLSAWETDLEETKQVVAVEDFKTASGIVEYNGWVEELTELSNELKK